MRIRVYAVRGTKSSYIDVARDWELRKPYTGASWSETPQGASVQREGT
jgi:hypothetical protein